MYAIAPAAGTRVGRAMPAHDRDLLTLLVLREIEDNGPLTGLETLNRVARASLLLRLAPAGYPTLHGLAEAAMLEIVPGRPPTYRITASGRHEAERLARTSWPRLSTELDGLSESLRPATPRRATAVRFASEWAEEPDDGSVGPARR